MPLVKSRPSFGQLENQSNCGVVASHRCARKGAGRVARPEQPAPTRWPSSARRSTSKSAFSSSTNCSIRTTKRSRPRSTQRAAKTISIATDSTAAAALGRESRDLCESETQFRRAGSRTANLENAYRPLVLRLQKIACLVQDDLDLRSLA